MRWAAALLILVLAACEPEATPLPAYVSPEPALQTASPLASEVTGRPVRYALTANTQGLIAELPLLEASAQVVQLAQPVTQADLAGRYDLIAGYGEQVGWALSPVTTTVSLVINTALAPLDAPAVADVLRFSVDPYTLAENLPVPGVQPIPRDTLSISALKTALANAGWPDGFDAAVGVALLPGTAAVVDGWRALGLGVYPTTDNPETLAPAFESRRLHLVLVAWTTPEERAAWATRAGEANVIDLYTLPISYWASEGLRLRFTPGGWPLAAP